MGSEAVTIALAFADRLNRFRALTGEEVDMLVALSRTDTQARARRHGGRAGDTHHAGQDPHRRADHL